MRGTHFAYRDAQVTRVEQSALVTSCHLAGEGEVGVPPDGVVVDLLSRRLLQERAAVTQANLGEQHARHERNVRQLL